MKQDNQFAPYVADEPVLQKPGRNARTVAPASAMAKTKLPKPQKAG